VAQDDPGNWARQSLGRVREWVGAGGLNTNPNSDWRKSRLSRSLGEVTNQLASEWDQHLADVAFALMEHPGRPVVAAEAALNRFLKFCHEASATQHARYEQRAILTQQAWEQLEAALAQCLEGAGGFSFFGNRSRRLLRVFIDQLTAFTRQRLTEEVYCAGLQF